MPQFKTYSNRQEKNEVPRDFVPTCFDEKGVKENDSLTGEIRDKYIKSKIYARVMIEAIAEIHGFSFDLYRRGQNGPAKCESVCLFNFIPQSNTRVTCFDRSGVRPVVSVMSDPVPFGGAV